MYLAVIIDLYSRKIVGWTLLWWSRYLVRIEDAAAAAFFRSTSERQEHERQPA